MPQQSEHTFYGKYRGLVTDNKDPLHLGRIRAVVPDVGGNQAIGWALPCAPFGGSQLGFFALPDVGAGVWIEFECGDPDYPIWTGCFWGQESQRPSVLGSSGEKQLLIKTKEGHSILLDGSASSTGITIQAAGGQKIVLDANGILLDNGSGAKIELSSSRVSVNGGALEVS
jgi:uncharacterized protein involved in type VI secretion and phage assembly